VAYTHYDRLSATDATFLEIEDPSVHMHVGAVAIFEGGVLRRADGAVDIDRVRDYIDGALHQVARFRQKLTWVPLFRHPVWVDDERFNLRYHVRHTALPAPGSIRQLKRLAGRIWSQKLDRGKPMWEMWVVEGLEDGRFALIVKAHHCMVDGVGGLDLFAAILKLTPDTDEHEQTRRWVARRKPHPASLVAGETAHRATLPMGAVRSIRTAISHPLHTLQAAGETTRSIVDTIGAGFQRTSPTPLNPDIGPYRRFDWMAVDIAEIRAVREQLGGTLNDVVLSTVAGAVGRFLAYRGEAVTRDTVFKTMVPVSIRSDQERGVAGNRVVNFLARLPVDEHDPVRRLTRTREAMAELKGSRLVDGAKLLEDVGDLTFTSVVVQFVRMAASARAYNLVVTNIPGPTVPIYFLGALLDEIYPMVPLFTNQGLGIALFSYDGKLCWGFNADWEAMPDLHDFVGFVDKEFQLLRNAAARAADSSEEQRTIAAGR